MLDKVRRGSKSRVNVGNNEGELFSGRFGSANFGEDGK